MADDLKLLVQEVQRLSSEVKHLRGRVEAYEASRWWRLHPRFALRGLFLRSPTRTAEDEPAEPDRAAVSSDAGHELVSRFRLDVIERGLFTHDWFLEHIPELEPLFESLDGRPTRLLEIGSFEGLSACYFLWRLPAAQVTCVDTFAGSVEHAVEPVNTSTLEEVFTDNVALIDSSRVRALVGDSRRVLVHLAALEERFDLVYVDGSHLGLDVLVDAALSWPLLDIGGFLVFDDYCWKALGEDALLRPGPAIDAFLGVIAGKHELLRRNVQVAVRKTG